MACFPLVLVLGLFRLLILSWLNFGGLAESRYSSISFMLHIKHDIVRLLKYFIMVLKISSSSVVMFPCSFLILLIWVLSLFLLVGPRVCHSHTNESKKQADLTNHFNSCQNKLKPKLIRRDWEGHYILIKEKTYQEDIAICNNCAPSS